MYQFTVGIYYRRTLYGLSIYSFSSYALGIKYPNSLWPQYAFCGDRGDE